MSDQKNDLGDDVDDLSDSDESDPEERPSRAPFDSDLDCDDDDDDDEAEAPIPAPAAQTPFSLKGGNSAFSDRSQSIFDCLDSVPPLTSSSSLNQDRVTDGDFLRPRPPQPGGKAPQPPPSSSAPPKKRGVPDYLVHPERWTRYSLEDVPETSDRDNSRAAHSFLLGLQRDGERDSPRDVQERMIFSRPNRQLKEQTADQLSAVRGKKRGMHLSHLEEEGEEEEEAGAQGRKREKTGGGRAEQSGEDAGDRDEERTEEASAGFSSFRKTKAKNFRKSSEQDDS